MRAEGGHEGAAGEAAEGHGEPRSSGRPSTRLCPAVWTETVVLVLEIILE